MTHGQQQKFANAYRPYHDSGGRLTVDGVPAGEGLEDVVSALSCLDASTVESLMSDMATFAMMMRDQAQNPFAFRPSEIPNADSKATLHISCASGSWGVTWS